MKIKLQQILNEKDISIYSLAKETNISPNNLSKIIKGETTSIKYDNLEKICIALDIKPNDIFQIEYPCMFESSNKPPQGTTLIGIPCDTITNRSFIFDEDSKRLSTDYKKLHHNINNFKSSDIITETDGIELNARAVREPYSEYELDYDKSISDDYLQYCKLNEEKYINSIKAEITEETAKFISLKFNELIKDRYKDMIQSSKQNKDEE